MERTCRVATISVEEDIRYHIQENDSETEKYLASKFKWLDKFILYLPLFVRVLPSKKSRSKRCNVFITLCVILIFLYLFCMMYGNMWLEYIGYQETQQILLFIIGIFGCFVMFTERVFSLIYYLYYFNFPWHGNEKYNCYNADISRGCIARNHKLMIQCLGTTYCLLNMIISVCAAMLINGGVKWQMISSAIQEPVYSLTVEIPNFLTLIIHCIVCFKYHWYLSQLIHDINNNMDLTETAMQYKMIYDSFKKDYNFYLRWSVIIYVINWLIWMYVGSLNPVFSTQNSGNMMQAMVGLATFINVIIYFFLYITCSSLVSERFQSLQVLLWKYTRKYIGNTNEVHNVTVLTALISYCNKYPVHIRFGGLIMTKKNISVFALTFIAVKALTELVIITY